MDFNNIQLEDILQKLEELDPAAKPQWGSMSAQRMIEHLSDTLDLAMGNISGVELEIPAEKVERAQGFILSEHPMPKNFEATFAPANVPTRNESFELAIDELALKWVDFENFFEEQPQMKTLHPNFGELNKDLWLKLNAKHIKHHLEQFALV